MNDVLGYGVTADRADVTLRRDEGVELFRRQSECALQMIPTPPDLSTAFAVWRKAVSSSPSPVPLGVRHHLTTTRAVLVPRWHVDPVADPQPL